jgi:hypothetical protein
VWAPLNLKKYSSKMVLSKIQNLEHKNGAIRAQFLQKIDGAQSSIDKWPIPLKDIVVEPNAGP